MQVGMPLDSTEHCVPLGHMTPRQGGCGFASARTCVLPANTSNRFGTGGRLPNVPVTPTTAVSPGDSVRLCAGARMLNRGGKPPPPSGCSTPSQIDWNVPVNSNRMRQLSSGTASLLVMRNSPWKQQASHALTVTNVAVMPGVVVVSGGVEIDGPTLPAASRASTENA